MRVTGGWDHGYANGNVYHVVEIQLDSPSLCPAQR